MTRSEAYFAGVKAGREAAKDGQLIHAIEAPEDYNSDQRHDYVSGWLVGMRAQQDYDLIDRIIAHDV